MAIIALPDNQFRSVQWTLVQPTQVNRSEFTSARQVMQLPGASYWRASAEHAPIVGEAGIRAWRAFIAKAQGQASTFNLPATESQQSAEMFHRLAPYANIDAAQNVSIVGRTITKTAGAAFWGTAWANSSGSRAGGARASFRAGQANKQVLAGLNDSVAGAAGYTALDYAFYLREDGRYDILQSGVSATGSAGYGRYSTSDVFSVVYDDAIDKVQFYRNGELILSSATASGRSFIFDSQFIEIGASILDAAFGGDPAITGVDAGSTSLFLSGFSGGQTGIVKEGWLATALLYGGGAQLVTITADADADANGTAKVDFLPMLRKKPFCLVTGRPWARVAMDSPELGWSVDPGAVYGFGFSATEAF